MRSPDPLKRRVALEKIVAAYWKPAYKYLRLQWRESNEDAKDLTQAFFARAIDKDFFSGHDPTRASFRTYLRTCLDGFVANERKAALRLKRGGDAEFVSLDDHPDALNTEEVFRREWLRSLFELALDTLRKECEARGKSVHFRLFERYDVEQDASYEQLGAEFSIPLTSVTNYLAFARREFRRIVLEKLREICGSEEEFRAEARLLLGVSRP